MDSIQTKVPWYIGGLCFQCLECGRCCSGPDEGFIWVSRVEIRLIAEFLKISEDQLRQKYLRRVGLRTTIIERPVTKDCVFLEDIEGRKRCRIYPVRPHQCRAWPFWQSNLANAAAWNRAGVKCGGINRGKRYSLEEIEAIRSTKEWWTDGKESRACAEGG